MKTKLGVVIGALIIALGFVTAPVAVAASQPWEAVSSARASLGGLRSASEPIAICTGDTQLNFLYHGQLGKNASFTTISTTPAGQVYQSATTERGWDSSVSAANTGVLAAVLDLWGTNEFSRMPIEAFTIATRMLSDDPRAGAVSKNATWNAQAKQIISEARKIAGPHKAAELTVSNSAGKGADAPIDVSGFTVSGAAGTAISGIPFRAVLTGGTWQSTGKAELTGYSAKRSQTFAVMPTGFGEISVHLEFENLPGNEFRTGHHAVAQDMHLRGSRGTAATQLKLRAVMPGTAVSLTTQAKIYEDNVVDTVFVSAEDWPVFGEERAQLELEAKLYGPFDLPQDQQEQVPADSLLADTATMVVTEPGEYQFKFSPETKSTGWYTVVVTGQFRTDGNFAQLPNSRIVMPFFEPAETVVVKNEPHITTVAKTLERDGEIYLIDDVEIAGFPENHGDWAGSEHWEADANLIQELHFIPTLETISDADLSTETLVHAVEISAVNGMQQISDPKFKVDKQLGAGTYVFITKFPGDARVDAFATSAAEQSEQYRYQPPKTPTYPELPETGPLTVGLGALGLGITGLGVSALWQKKQN